ncbi:hypothetical protein QOZ80_3AG0224140 [Eleusine coracana subsp. coracana]|nr:hypothetical protein QOZ80_3AG0224140 [Eleusine coracana subsp. coracana]
MASSLISLVLLLFHAAAATAQVVAGGDAPVPELPRSELAAVFRVMADLLGDPTWAQAHPRPCTDTPWPGLQCEVDPDDARRLRATRLHFGPDVATPPCRSGAALAADALRGLPHLKTLSLFSCFINTGAAAAVELPPALFANASSSLEQVVLKSNPGLTGAVPATLGGVRGLRVLSLSQNAFRGGIPRELGGLPALQQLDLSYNNITGEIPEEIGGMASLTILDMSWNGITGAVPSAIGKLHNLQKADLSYNRLTGRVPPELGSLQNLVFLDLGHNALTGPLPSTLAGLGRLQYLLLQDNPLGTAVPAVVGSMRRLQVLGLSGCGLTGPVPFFAGLRSLTALSLDRNRLDGPIPPGLAALPHLGQLNLSQNRLAGEIALPGDFVARLGRRLDVRGNRQLCVGKRLQGTTGGYLVGARPCEGGDAAAAAAQAEGSGAAGGWRRGFDEDGVGIWARHVHVPVVLLFLVYRL